MSSFTERKYLESVMGVGSLDVTIHGGLSNTAESSTASAAATHSAPVSAQDRSAILDRMYAERRELLGAKRSGALSANQLDYLSELNQYIDNWEKPETRSAKLDDVWSKLETLGSSVLMLQAKIKHPKR